MVDAKTTHAVLRELPRMPPESKPIQILTILNRKYPLCCLSWVILYGPNILDFFTEIVIIRGLPHWISAQSIYIRMLRAWSVQYLEVEILQHIDPPTPPTMCI